MLSIYCPNASLEYDTPHTWALANPKASVLLVNGMGRGIYALTLTKTHKNGAETAVKAKSRSKTCFESSGTFDDNSIIKRKGFGELSPLG